MGQNSVRDVICEFQFSTLDIELTVGWVGVAPLCSEVSLLKCQFSKQVTFTQCSCGFLSLCRQM